MKIGLACDHAGFLHKEKTKEYLETLGYTVNDYGCFSEESVDYPDFAHQLANSIKNNLNLYGIQFCGTGNGINMSANKHQEIRAALCWSAEISKLSRQHNDANILSIPARFVNIEQALEMVDLFVSTPFEGGRHQKRIEKIPCK